MYIEKLITSNLDTQKLQYPTRKNEVNKHFKFYIKSAFLRIVTGCKALTPVPSLI